MQYFGFDRPSFGFKTFGFGESSPPLQPKLQADFTTGTYKVDGESRTFADLFTFSRAGKAWLVKDIGLQEYAVDVPRFDEGLLIEQAATNYSKYSTLPENLDAIKGGVTYRDGYWRMDDTASSGYLYVGLSALPTGQATISIKPLNTSLFAYCIYGGAYASLPKTQELQVVTVSGEGTGFFGLTWGSDEKEAVAVYIQYELGDVASSIIKTATTPVTRPADFLTSKITGTTVTGDWDSTLTLSIVDGNLVHSGYGRIRSLEIK